MRAAGLARMLAVLLVGAGLLLAGGCQPAVEEGTPDNPYRIVWYTIGTPQKDLKLVEARLNEYLREKIGAELDIRMIDWANYREKMNVVLISGENYDLCFTASWSNPYEQNAMRGAFYPLNDLLDRYGQGIKEALDPRFIEGAKINGQLYAIPANKEIGQQVVYRINYDLMTKLGFSLSDFRPLAGPDSLRSLAPYFQKIREQYPGYTPYAIFGNMNYLMGDMDFILANSGLPGAVRIEQGNYKVFNQYEDREFQEYFRLYREFYEKGYIAPDAAQIRDDQSIIVSGRWGADYAGYQPYADNIWSAAMNMKIVSFPEFRPIVTKNSVMGSMMAISINSRRPDIVMKFLNLLNTDPYVRNTIQYGIEGIHYQKIAANRIEFLPGHANYEMPGFSLGNLFITYLVPGDPDDKWERFREWNDSAVSSQILGFHFDHTPVTAELAAVTSVMNQYGPGLFTGQSDPGVALPKLNQELKKAGLDRLLAEQQRQLDEWVKNRRQ
ncbi:MAG: ABC transporter substrate-binding protein [Negativicutes bacterium]|nr:ABC transporter substrate-binding protein [Negativicutes bacterium]